MSAHQARNRYPKLIGASAIALAAMSAAALFRYGSLFPSLRSGPVYLAGPAILAQEDEDAEDAVAPAEVEKYINVYRSMQRNHDLTVEQAAARQGLKLDDFRDIERRIERNDPIRERVRQALRPGAQDSSGAAASKKNR